MRFRTVAIACCVLSLGTISSAIPCGLGWPDCPTGMYCYECSGDGCWDLQYYTAECCTNGVHACCDVQYSKVPIYDPELGFSYYCIMGFEVDCDCNTIE